MSTVAFSPKYCSKYNNVQKKNAFEDGWVAATRTVGQSGVSYSEHRSYTTRKMKEMAKKYER